MRGIWFHSTSSFLFPDLFNGHHLFGCRFIIILSLRNESKNTIGLQPNISSYCKSPTPTFFFRQECQEIFRTPKLPFWGFQLCDVGDRFHQIGPRNHQFIKGIVCICPRLWAFSAILSHCLKNHGWSTYYRFSLRNQGQRRSRSPASWFQWLILGLKPPEMCQHNSQENCISP